MVCFTFPLLCADAVTVLSMRLCRYLGRSNSPRLVCLFEQPACGNLRDYLRQVQASCWFQFDVLLFRAIFIASISSQNHCHLVTTPKRRLALWHVRIQSHIIVNAVSRFKSLRGWPSSSQNQSCMHIWLRKSILSRLILCQHRSVCHPLVPKSFVIAGGPCLLMRTAKHAKLVN